MNLKRYLMIVLFVCSFISFSSAQKTKYVVIVVIDGARYTETFGDSSHTYIPKIWNILRPQGTIYTSYYNNGKTETNPGHSSILSGVYQYISNDGNERAHTPTVFEYFRKEDSIPANECWVALGKDKLDVLAYSDHAQYGSSYGASIRTSADPANDVLTYDNIRYVLTNYRSRITAANFARTDIDGHGGAWNSYLSAIQRADTLVTSLWNSIQSDSVLKNKTTLVITNDHGRHTTDFISHGDGCEGCRHIMLLILGPDTPKNLIDSTLCSQVDIVPTIGKMMKFSTPLVQGNVIESAIAAAVNIPLSIKNMPSGKISGIYDLQWSVGTTSDTVTTLVEYSRDGGMTWKQLLHTTSKDSSFQWDTQNVPDGTRYRIRIQVSGDTIYGITQSTQNFTIDNPANSAPDVQLLSPNRNIIISGTEAVTWFAGDAEGNSVSISLYGSADSGKTWTSIAGNIPNSGSYMWNTTPQANSKFFRLKITGSDGSLSAESFSPVFEIANVRQAFYPVGQISGAGGGVVKATVNSPAQLTGDSYRIIFSGSVNTGKRYSVMNLSKNSTVLENIPFFGDGSEGPLFDGLRLAITDFVEPTHNKDSTRWIKGNSTLFSKVLLPEIHPGDETVQATPEAADYEIRISDVVVDTSKDYFSATPTEMYFTVYNTTLNKKTPLIIFELIPDGKLSFGDDIYLFRQDSSGKDVLSWEIYMEEGPVSVSPLSGDIYKIATYKPILGNDIFEFTAAVTEVNDTHLVPGQFWLSQNFPNPFNPSTAIQFSIAVPSIVTLKIYDLLGKEVRTLVQGIHAAGYYQYEMNGSQLASGLYFYRMIAASPDGEKMFFNRTNKMLLLK